MPRRRPACDVAARFTVDVVALLGGTTALGRIQQVPTDQQPPPRWLVNAHVVFAAFWLLPIASAVEEGNTFQIVLTIALGVGWLALGLRQLRARRRLLA